MQFDQFNYVRHRTVVLLSLDMTHCLMIRQNTTNFVCVQIMFAICYYMCILCLHTGLHECVMSNSNIQDQLENELQSIMLYLYQICMR